MSVLFTFAFRIFDVGQATTGRFSTRHPVTSNPRNLADGKVRIDCLRNERYRGRKLEVDH